MSYAHPTPVHQVPNSSLPQSQCPGQIRREGDSGGSLGQNPIPYKRDWNVFSGNTDRRMGKDVIFTLLVFYCFSSNL